MALALASTAIVVGCDKEFTQFADEPAGTAHVGGNGGSNSGGSNSGGSSSDGGGATCVDFGDACSACEVSACEQSFCECYGNADCALYASCVLACDLTDGACLQDCNTQYPDGITDVVLLNDCAANACADECSEYPLLALTDCQQCTYESCEPQMNACLANPDCANVLFCVDECAGDMQCFEGCYAKYPGGLTDAAEVGACNKDNCLSTCYQS